MRNQQRSKPWIENCTPCKFVGIIKEIWHAMIYARAYIIRLVFHPSASGTEIILSHPLLPHLSNSIELIFLNTLNIHVCYTLYQHRFNKRTVGMKILPYVCVCVEYAMHVCMCVSPCVCVCVFGRIQIQTYTPCALWCMTYNVHITYVCTRYIGHSSNQYKVVSMLW